VQGLAVFLSKFSEGFSISCKKKEPNALPTFKAHSLLRRAFEMAPNNAPKTNLDFLLRRA